MTIHRKTCLGTRQPLTTPQKTVNDSSDFLPSDQLPSIQLPKKIALHFPAPKIMMPTIFIPDPYQTSTNLAPQIHLFTASTRSQRHAESSYTRPLPPHIVISHTRLDVPANQIQTTRLSVRCRWSGFSAEQRGFKPLESPLRQPHFHHGSNQVRIGYLNCVFELNDSVMRTIRKRRPKRQTANCGLRAGEHHARKPQAPMYKAHRCCGSELLWR